MKLIVITSAENFENEHDIIDRMFRHGLKYLHVRKPKFDRKKMLKYLEGFSPKYRDRIIVHSHHSLAFSLKLKGIHITEKQRKDKYRVWKRFFLFRLRRPNLQITTSYHKLKDIDKNKQKYDYVFLSPIFESISKEDYKPVYTLGSIYDVLHHSKVQVIALGGVDNEKIGTCYETRFSGVALSGYIWNADDQVKNFDTVKELCDQYKIPS